MRKGWAPDDSAFTSFLNTTLQSSLPIGSFFVRMVFNVPMLKTCSFVYWYDLFIAPDYNERVAKIKQSCIKI
jgi:hypothetical protein